MTVQTTAETVKSPKPAVLPKRTLRVLAPVLPGQAGQVRVTETSGARKPRVEVDTYAVSVSVEDEGLLASFLKTGRTVNGVEAPFQQVEPYHTVVGGGEPSCDCWGFLRHAHCRHVELIEALIAAGHLTEGGGK